jgi:hypothetical protein
MQEIYQILQFLAVLEIVQTGAILGIALSLFLVKKKQKKVVLPAKMLRSNNKKLYKR